jgi:hypothetical protein
MKKSNHGWSQTASPQKTHWVKNNEHAEHPTQGPVSVQFSIDNNGNKDSVEQHCNHREDDRQEEEACTTTLVILSSQVHGQV